MQSKTITSWGNLHRGSWPEEPRKVAREDVGAKKAWWLYLHVQRLGEGKRQQALETISEFAPQKHLFWWRIIPFLQPLLLIGKLPSSQSFSFLICELGLKVFNFSVAVKGKTNKTWKHWLIKLVLLKLQVTPDHLRILWKCRYRFRRSREGFEVLPF